MQLLRITTRPMQYELKIQHPELNYEQDLIPSAEIQTESAKLNISKMENTQVNIDTYECRKSLGRMSVGDSIEISNQKMEKHISELTREYVEIGKQISNIEDGVSIGDVFKSKMLDAPTLYTAYLPKGGAELSWRPAMLEFDFQEGSSDVNWQVHDSKFNFVPGDITLQISELASVEIEYLGGPMYVPPSAAPDYEEK